MGPILRVRRDDPMFVRRVYLNPPRTGGRQADGREPGLNKAVRALVLIIRMVRVLRDWFALAAVFVLAMGQVLGLHRGYVCACVDEAAWVGSPDCVAEHCHPGAAHGDGCLDNHSDSAPPGDSEDVSHGHHGGGVPGHPHKHIELREWADFATVGPLVIPPRTAIEIGAFDNPEMAGSVPIHENILAALPSRPERGPPPMSLLVARSVVRLL
jgi:hypothetical protein